MEVEGFILGCDDGKGFVVFTWSSQESSGERVGLDRWMMSWLGHVRWVLGGAGISG